MPQGRKTPSDASVRFRSSTPAADGFRVKFRGDALDDKKSATQLKFTNPSFVWGAILILHFLVALYVDVRNKTYPTPLASSEAGFSEERARNHLRSLTNLGSRIVGSNANQRGAVDYLLTEIGKIAEDWPLISHELKVDIQTAKGSFDLDFLGGFTNVYENINNVVVSIGPSNSKKDIALLINCHYDTFLNTQGASDDTVSCATMLEVMRAVVSKHSPPSTQLIFLFNGAEETILQGSHAFVTSHPWFQGVKAFINLEAAGAGGKELLFQTAPDHPWLLKMYADSVPYPFASSLAQEIFQSGIVQSDTDFRIFRDFGQIPGMDIAYVRNGFFYHTRHDTPDKIPPGCIQRAGENILALIMAMSRYLYIFEMQPCPEDNSMFFDVLGYFLFSIGMKDLVALNVLFCCVFHLRIIWFLCIQEKTDRTRYFQRLLFAAGSIFASWIASLIVTAAIAFVIDLIGCSMTWFNNNWLLIGLYAIPTLATANLIMTKLKAYWSKVERLSSLHMEVIVGDAEALVVSVVLLWMSWKELASSFFLLFFLISMSIRLLIKFVLKAGDTISMICSHFISTFCLVVVNVYNSDGLITTFLPLMGRAGASINADLIIGVLVCLTTNYLLLCHLSLLFLIDIPKPRLIFGCTFFIFLFLATCTAWGFPYSSDPDYPVNQRIFIQHVHRRFNNFDGKLSNRSVEETSMMFIPLDRTSLTHLLPIEQLNFSQFQRLSCIDFPYCGWPYFLPLAFHMDQVYHLPAAKLDVEPKVWVKFAPVITMGDASIVGLSYSGPEYMSIYITPCPGISLTKWNVGDGYPRPTKMPIGVERLHYFVFVSSGTIPVEPLSLNLTMMRDDQHQQTSCLVQLAVVGHYFPMDDRPAASTTLAFYLHHLPSWVSPLYSASTYESWTI